MQFRLLGVLEAGSGGATFDLGPPKQRALLAILLLHVGEIVPLDRLIDLLWGVAPPRTAAHSIQIYVSELRKALETPTGGRLIHTRPPGYQLDAPRDTIDAWQFEALVGTGTARLDAGDREGAVAALRSALELWRGPALSDFAYEEFAQPYVRRLHDMHLDAVETLASAELESGQASRIVPLLEAAIREDPLRERSRELLMLALYRSGRHAEALRTYENLRHVLGDELGLDPSPPLQALRDRILLHDPALFAAARAEAAPATARNPYKGLHAFGEGDAHDFFGREALVEQLVQSLAAGRRLLALVGPSGSGKSSVVAAGLVPRIRAGDIAGSERWRIANVALGPDPLGEVRAIVRRATASAPPGDRLDPAGLALPALGDGARLVLVIDHFEQLFTVAEESRRGQLLRALAAEIERPGSPLVVVLTLRADFYDRPLQHPEFGAAFVPGVVHVLPMTARELEAAVVVPAEQVGVRIEAALLAELMAESVSRPGSLPLLQYSLTELFEQRSGPDLTLAGYAAIGGLRGVLSRRAEAVFLGLDADEQRIATQVFLRLVRLGRGAADSRRRLTLSELTDLGIDPVALSTVLTSFGRHHLLTFDHDPATDEATVELAHEALLTEWERLAGWIDRHRAALRRRDALVSAVDEWELSGRDRDYLLSGSRLAEFETWSQEGSLQLTSRERDYLEAGLEARRGQEAAEAAKVEAHRRLARSARARLLALVAAVVALVGGAAYVVMAAPGPVPDPVAFVWADEGLVSVQAVSGFDGAVTEFGLVGRKLTWEGLWAGLEAELGEAFWEGMTDEQIDAQLARAQADDVRRLSEEGVGLIVVQQMSVEVLDEIAADYPGTRYATGQPGSAPNVAYLTVVQSEPSYLAGAAAALKSTTGVIGYVGGVDWDGIWGFQAGFEAGARAVDPDIDVRVTYLSEGDFTGFGDIAGAKAAALEMFGRGADVVMHAAGTAGLGVIEAATEYSRAEGRHVWAIGVDTDQYETVMRLPGATDAGAWQSHILTSVLTGIDTMTYAVVADHARGTFRPGAWKWGLASGAIGISYSGGYIDDIRPRLEELQADIVAGRIDVPCIPPDRLEAAAALGIGPTDCRD